MKHFISICSICCIALCSINNTATAQQHPSVPKNGDVTILLGDKDKDVKVYNIFINNAPQAFHIPGAPRFAIKGKNNQFYLGVGGSVKTTVSFDWGNPINNATNFTTSIIPMHLAKGNGGLLQFSAATSNLFANFIALPGSKNQVGVYISGNFTGAEYGFDLQFAYMKYRGITAGYNYTLFCDLAAAPPTIDNENAPGLTIVPNAVIDYIYTINPKWSVAIGAELPITSITPDKYTYAVNQRIPDIPAYVQYSWNKGGSWLRLSAIMRNMQYRNMVADKNQNVTGWGIKASGSAAITNKLTAFYQGAYGKGITSYFQDTYGLNLDLVPNQAQSGKLSTSESWGGYFTLQYDFCPQIFASTTYSQIRNYTPLYNVENATPWNEQYKYAQYLVSNVFWNITPYLQTGVEYLWGKRVNMDGLSRHNNRLQTMLRLSF